MEQPNVNSSLLDSENAKPIQEHRSLANAALLFFTFGHGVQGEPAIPVSSRSI
jgi:hypothetical protein